MYDAPTDCVWMRSFYSGQTPPLLLFAHLPSIVIVYHDIALPALQIPTAGGKEKNNI